ncbi:hypothetical protein GCM10022225_63940 [Plantactinospora mayteni]|uniref:DUF4913 domain-containing protein n=1 Tax=Plantactinospora mayteni TaxID=566021 RepID=A0ABQ4F079_9ACTN|nr:hypothetical protein [Plantactinospora mayteni]GIH00323.1 hypothetical protein Pma05_68950 [Plantactinospora mayteni]
MTDSAAPAPWAWDDATDEAYEDLWARFVRWVDWVEREYAPWVVLPPCWPVHEALRFELTLLWYAHDAALYRSTDPISGIQWHVDLRNAANAWRALATCDHREPSPEQRRIEQARRDRRDEFAAEAMTRRSADPANHEQQFETEE